jgi:hypothetical protein
MNWHVDSDDEARLRTAFATEAERLTPAPFPLGAIVLGGRALRRRRRVRASAALAAAVLVPAVAGAFGALGGHGQRGTQVEAAPPGLSASPSPSGTRPQVRVVRPDQRLRLAGSKLWLTADPAGKCVWSEEGGTGCRKVVDPNTIDGPGILGAQGDGALTSGIYRGPGKPAYAAVTVENVTVPGTIVTLAGDPGWAVYYAVTPQRSVRGSTPPSAPRVVVYDAAGKALATLAPPAGR